MSIFTRKPRSLQPGSLTVLAVLAVSAALDTVSAAESGPGIKEMLMPLGIAVTDGAPMDFTLVRHLKRGAAGSEMESFEFSALNQRVLRLQRYPGVSSNESSVFMKRRRGEIEAVYFSKVSPYFGSTKPKVICPKRYQPKFVTHADRRADAQVTTLFASERRTYGVCEEGSAYYQVRVMQIHCKAGRFLIESEEFVRIGDKREFVSNFLQCP